MALSEDTILDFLEYELGVETNALDGNSPLFSAGVVDSFALVSLMMFLEREGGFRIHPSEVNLDNLDSVGRMLSMAQRLAA